MAIRGAKALAVSVTILGISSRPVWWVNFNKTTAMTIWIHSSVHGKGIVFNAHYKKTRSVR
jgi:hypothetical protein